MIRDFLFLSKTKIKICALFSKKAYCKVGLRSHKMTQITEFKPLEDGDS